MAEGHYWRIIVHLCLCLRLSENMHISHPFLPSGEWARWPTVLAVISGWQLSSFLETTSFLSSWTQTSLLSEGQHLLVLKDVSGLWSSTLTALWPFPIPQPYLTHTGLHRSTRGDMCLTLQGDVSSCFTLWCEWTNKMCFILTDPSGLELLSHIALFE